MSTSWIETGPVGRRHALPLRLLNGRQEQGTKIRENVESSTQGGEEDLQQRNQKISAGHRDHYH